MYLFKKNEHDFQRIKIEQWKIHNGLDVRHYYFEHFIHEIVIHDCGAVKGIKFSLNLMEIYDQKWWKIWNEMDGAPNDGLYEHSLLVKFQFAEFFEFRQISSQFANRSNM